MEKMTDNEAWGIHKIIQEAIKNAHTTPSPETLKKLQNIEEKLTDNYSKRELDEHFTDSKKDSDNILKNVVELVGRVGIQNGRLGKLESKFLSVTIAGTCAIFLLGIIMSLIVYSFQISQDNLKNSILLEVRNLIQK